MRTHREIQQRAPVWFIAMLLINLALMSWSARDPSTRQRKLFTWASVIAAPFQMSLSWVSGTGTGFFADLANLRSAATENRRLKERLFEVEMQLREAHAARMENDRLRALLDLKEKAEYGIIPARVIARDPSIWFKSIIINRGQVAGVEESMPVVTGEGVIGRVLQVNSLSAQVLMLTDEKAAAGAVVGQIESSTALGTIKGRGHDGLLEMRYVSGLEKVSVGDKVTTTGQDGIFPPNLPIGEIIRVETGSATASHVITVKPSANLDSLKDVAVLRYHPPTAADGQSGRR